jgi:uncharacterized membrane protein YesL
MSPPAWRLAAWVVYDHVGGLVVANLLWTLASLPWLAVAAVLVAAGWAAGGMWVAVGCLLAAQWALLSPPTLALCLAASDWLRCRPVPARRVARVTWSLALSAQGAGLLCCLATAVLAVNVSFYTSMGGWLGLVLAGLAIWGALLVGTVSLSVLPLLALHGGGLRAALQRSLRWLVLRPRTAASLMAATLVVLGLGLVSGVGLACGLLAAWAVWSTAIVAGSLGWPGGAPPPDLARRGLADLLRPWAGDRRSGGSWHS